MKYIPEIKKYNLDGGSKVTVYKIFGKRFYFAVVEMDGRYPGKGQFAHNVGRNEFVLVLDGKISVTKNEENNIFSRGQTVTFEDGCRYEISGKGRSLVFVDDGTDLKGESRIETKE